ncbi:TATA box-binding protein-associated factor RNA polymerase I subunit C [Chamberlinius hualienensis]
MNELKCRHLYPMWLSDMTVGDCQVQVPDYSSTGLQIDTKDGLMVIENGKNNFHPLAAKMVSLPFIPPSREGIGGNASAEICNLNVARWRRKLTSCQKIIQSDPELKAKLESTMANIVVENSSFVKLPEAVYKLANEMPSELIDDEKSSELYMHGGGSLCYQDLLNEDKNGFLLHSSGTNLTKMIITPIEKTDNAYSTLIPYNDKKVVKEFDSRIYQMETEVVAERIFCGVRMANKLEFGIVNANQNGVVAPEFLKTVENTDVTHFDLSPYRPGDYIFITSSGDYSSCNMEDISCTTCRNSISGIGKPIEKYRWSLQYSSHPRCFVCCNEKDVLVKDLRICNKTFSLIRNMGCLNQQEKIYTLKRSYDYLQYVGTTHSLLLIDQRYPGHPVLRWNHQLTSPPMFSSRINYSTKFFESSEAVILASRNVHDIVLFNTGHQDAQRSCSLSPPLVISNPSDFIDSLLLNNIVVDPSVRIRTESPLEGVVCIPTERGVTMLVATSAGDLFYQDFYDSSGEKPNEPGHRSGPGFNAVQLPPEIVQKTSEWADDVFKITIGNSSNSLPKNERTNASKVFKDMIASNSHEHGCSLCCHCDQLQKDSGNLSEICPSCGTKVELNGKLTTTAFKIGVNTGSLAVANEISSCISIPKSIEAGNNVVEKLTSKWTAVDELTAIDERVDETSVAKIAENAAGVSLLSTEQELCNNVRSVNINSPSQASDQDNYFGIAPYFLEISHD